MHNTLNVMLARVEHTVAPDMLDLCLRIANRHGKFVNNVTEFILKIIRERILLDCNISGGPIKRIVLKEAWREQAYPDLQLYDYANGGYDLYRIPPEARDNMPLTQAIRVSNAGGIVGDIPVAYIQDTGYNTLSAADSMLASYTFGHAGNAPLCTLLSGDLVKIFPSQGNHVDWILDCRSSYDENFSQVSVNGVQTLCKLSELAVKAYIYTNLYIAIDRAAQEFGVDLGTIRTIVEDCRDANQQYEEQLIIWKGTTLQDPIARDMHMQYQV